MNCGVNILMITLVRHTDGSTIVDVRINSTEVFRAAVSHEMALAINIALCRGIAEGNVRLWPETSAGVGFQAVWHDDEV